VDELTVLGEDRRVQVEGVHGHRRAGDALDRHPQLFVDVPEVVADDLVGDGIDLVRPLPVQRQARVDVQRGAGDVGKSRAVVRSAGDRWGGWPVRHVRSLPCFRAFYSVPGPLPPTQAIDWLRTLDRERKIGAANLDA